MASRNKDRDGGYAWVIMVAFFLIEVLVDGIRFTFGLYFVEFLEEFRDGKGKTAWIGSLMVATYNLCGPVFAAIINKIGFRKASLLGAILSTIGYILSYFAMNVYFLFFTYGILPGFGFGMLFLAGTTALGRYFEAKRSLAFGISLCGSGVGTFIITPLVAYLIDLYTWRGSLLILAGIGLNCCVLSSLYRPLVEESIEIETFKPPCKETPIVTNGVDNGSGAIISKVGTPLLPRTFAEMRKEQLQTLDGSDSKGSHRSLALSYRSLNSPVIAQSIFGSNASFGVMFGSKNKFKTSTSTVNVNVPISFPKSDRTVAEESGNVFKNALIESMFPKALITNINFIILMISSIFIGLPSFIPFSMLPDYGRSVGASTSESAWILSAIGIGGTIGRVGSGYLLDLPCVHNLTLLGTCLLIIGIGSVIVAYVAVYIVQMMYATIFGVFFGAIYVVQPIVLVEYFGADYIVEVMGVTMFVYGLSTILGAPMAGWIFDLTQSYTISFLVAGISFLLSGVINFTVLCTQPSRQARRMARMERDLNDSEDASD